MVIINLCQSSLGQATDVQLDGTISHHSNAQLPQTGFQPSIASYVMLYGKEPRQADFELRIRCRVRPASSTRLAFGLPHVEGGSVLE